MSLFQDVRTCPTLLHPSLSSQFQTDNDHPVVAEECADSRQRDISDLDILVAPLVEQLDAANLGCNLLGQDGVALGLLDFDLSGVRHFGDVKGGGLNGGNGRGWRGCRKVVARLAVFARCKFSILTRWVGASEDGFFRASRALAREPPFAKICHI